MFTDYLITRLAPQLEERARSAPVLLELRYLLSIVITHIMDWCKSDISFRSICQMAKDNNEIFCFIDFSKLNMLSLKLEEKLVKTTKGKSIKDVERCQFLKWIVSCYESLPPYIDKSDIGDCQLQSVDRSFGPLFGVIGFFHNLWFNISNYEWARVWQIHHGASSERRYK